MTDAIDPEPDVKDWTWTLSRACPECGFDPALVDRDDIPALTRIHAATLGAALAGPQAAERPRPDVWSPLEYGAHVRDVCILFRDRLALMLTQDDPEFPNWDQDETALTSRYQEQSPTGVSLDLRAAADDVADAFAAVQPHEWIRTSRRSNGSGFTVESFGTYFLHDLAHHVWDVTHA